MDTCRRARSVYLNDATKYLTIYVLLKKHITATFVKVMLPNFS